MEKELDLSQYSVRTDLAVEAKDIALENQPKPNNQSEIKGVIVKEKEE
ncbi:GPR endopeptidase, partial [Priestia megaterium]|nr:GPR endopeptidase [Priestia megaterium]